MYEKDGEVFPQKHCLAASILQVCRWSVFHITLQILLMEIPGAVEEPSLFELKEVDHRWKYQNKVAAAGVVGTEKALVKWRLQMKKAGTALDQESLWWWVVANGITMLPETGRRRDFPPALKQGPPQHISYAFTHLPMWDEATGALTWVHQWGRVELCTRMESLNATPHPPHHQEDNSLEVRAKSHFRGISAKVGFVPFQEELSKCIWEDAWSWRTAVGGPGWKWGENWSICHSALLIFPLHPSHDLSGLLQMCHVLFKELQTNTSSYIRILHHQDGATQENPLCSPKSAFNVPQELGQRLPWLSIQHVKGDTALGVCSSACFSLPRPWASSFRLPLWFIVLLHFWAPGKCFCPINFALEVSMLPRRKINHPGWEDVPHTASSLVWVPPSSAFHFLFPPTVPFPFLQEGRGGDKCATQGMNSTYQEQRGNLICPNIILLSI